MMKKYICLRDDDTSYFTSPEELIQGYGRHWGKIPITLGVVPFSHGSQIKMRDFEMEKDRFKALRNWEVNASAEQLNEYHKIHPIGDNKPLVSELNYQQSRGMVEIAQHGVAHRYNEFGAETRSSQLSLPQIRDGMEYLSKVFNKKIATYIPPSNTIDSECAHYISSLGMNIFTSGSISYNSVFEKIAGYVKYPKAILEKVAFDQIKPIRYRDGELLTHSYTYDNFKTQEEIFDVVKNSLERTGFVAIGTHYMLLNKEGYLGQHPEYREAYLSLIDKILKIKDIEFVTASEYIVLLKKHYYKSINKGDISL